MSNRTDTIDETPHAGGRRRPLHAEFMQIWEEGYVSNHISYENMHTPGLFIVEGAPLRGPDGRIDRSRVRAHIDAMMASSPHFRLRLQRSAFGLTPPAWVPDTAFDLSRHIVFSDEIVDVKTADLRRLAGAYGGRMPIKHPLWRVHVTELADGDVAVGTVLHHASLDGMSGMRLMAGMYQKMPDSPLPLAHDPFALERTPSAWQLPYLAFRQWRQRQGSMSEAWKDYWAKPFIRRARRVAARILLPVRFGMGGERARSKMLPPVHADYRRLDAAAVGRRARALGGSLSDLQVSAVIGAWDGEERVVRLRFPVSFHSPDTPHIRNHVQDMEVSGDADADIADIVASVTAQVARREAVLAGEPVPGFPIGYSTLLPWLSRPAYFCGGEVRAMIPFPASLGRDQLAAAGIIYNGSLFVGANMPVRRDARAVVGRIYELMSGMPDPGRP